MTNKQLLSYSLISFTLFLIILTLSACNSHQSAINANTEELTTYEYIITKIDSEGIHGQNISDNTGIFLTYDTVNENNVSLKENDKISVSFPIDDWETITKIDKIN